MLHEAGSFQDFLTERTHLFPRSRDNPTLILDYFYYDKSTEDGEEPIMSMDDFKEGIRKNTQEAYKWAMKEAMSYSHHVIIPLFISNLNTLIHGEENELPEVMTRSGNELFREWIQQFKVAELYYPVLEEFGSYNGLPTCLLEELTRWEEMQSELKSSVVHTS